MKKTLALLLTVSMVLMFGFAMADETYEMEMVGNSFSIEYCNINVDGARAAVEDLAAEGITVKIFIATFSCLNKEIPKVEPASVLLTSTTTGVFPRYSLVSMFFTNAPSGTV